MMDGVQEHGSQQTNKWKLLKTCQSSIKQGVCHIVALPFTLEKYLKEKEDLWKLKYFTMQKSNLQKNPPKETKILQDIITLL